VCVCVCVYVCLCVCVCVFVCVCAMEDGQRPRMNRQCSKSTPVRRQASALCSAAASSSIPVDDPPRILGCGRRGATFDGAEALQLTHDGHTCRLGHMVVEASRISPHAVNVGMSVPCTSPFS
jgi:hypothetical protein